MMSIVCRWNWLAFSSLLAICCGGCSTGLPPDAMKRVEEAEARFAQSKTPEDLLKVAGTYEQLLAKHPANPGLLYNQGNAFHQAGRKANAIACYRRALRYRPRDENINANLIVAAGESAVGERPLLERIMFWQNAVGYREKFVLLGISAIGTFVLGATFSLQPSWHAAKGLALIGIALTAVLACSAGWDVYRFEFQQHGVVSSQGVFAHSGPGKSYPQEFPIPFGVEFEVLEIRKGAEVGTCIRLPDGRTGWVADAIIY